MKLETLQAEMITAMKAKNKIRKDVISSMITAVKNKGIAEKCRENIPEVMVDEVILKEKKTMQEMIDTCPASRAETLAKYKAKMAIIDEFAPQLMTSAEEISTFITSLGIEVIPKNRGTIMKALKGKADMKAANRVIQGMMK